MIRIDHEDIAAHLAVDRYGEFSLTDAVRPWVSVPIVPQQGYRPDSFDAEGERIPVLLGAVSREHLFECFLALIDTLGPVVDAVLCSSRGGLDQAQEFYREDIDLPVLKSLVWDFEDLLTNCGCTGLAVVDCASRREVQFDEHKLLLCYGEPQEPFSAAFERFGVGRVDGLKLIIDGEHIHSTYDRFVGPFEELKARLGV